MSDTTQPSYNPPTADQLATLQSRVPDTLLLFRVANHYEAYGEDAVVSSGSLQLPVETVWLTGSYDGLHRVSIPGNAADSTIAKLLAAGHKVAVVQAVRTGIDPASLSESEAGNG